MTASRPLAAPIAGAALGLLVGLPAAAIAQDSATETDTTQHIGKLYDKIQASKQRQALTLERGRDDAHTRYARAKKQIENSIGISYTVDVSATAQWGVPDGGYAPLQALFEPAVNWVLFDDRTIGKGSFQFYYSATQYWSGLTSGAALQGRLGLNSPVNDYPTNGLSFNQVTYTQDLPGDWLSVSIGQYSFAAGDTNRYANNQQTGFLGYALAQNASQTYSSGSLGGYVEVKPGKQVILAAGVQDANNVSGSYIQFGTLGQGSYAWLLYGGFSPTLEGLGRGIYSVIYYSQPGVWAQPQASEGVSFNAMQPLGRHWGVFVRANTAWGSSFAIQSSIAGGAVYNNPLGRNPLDQIGLGVAWNRTNTNVYPPTLARPSETMAEFYWNWTLVNGLQITPDIQVFLQPALAPGQGVTAVFSVRAALLF